MSTRRLSSRIASSPAKYAAVTSLNAGIATEAPRVKRRRKDTPSSLHNDDAVLPTKPDCDSSNSDKSGDVQRASSIGGGDKDGGGMRSPSTSVVMVQVPEGFSFAHAACRCLCRTLYRIVLWRLVGNLFLLTLTDTAVTRYFFLQVSALSENMFECDMFTFAGDPVVSCGRGSIRKRRPRTEKLHGPSTACPVQYSTAVGQQFYDCPPLMSRLMSSVQAGAYNNIRQAIDLRAAMDRQYSSALSY